MHTTTVAGIGTVDSTGDVGFDTSIALDSNDNPHISYYDESNDDLKYAYYEYRECSWDITGTTMWVPDGKCDIRDVAIVALHYGSVEGDGRYDVRADITGPDGWSDGKIDIRDISLVAIHYGEVYQ